MAGIAVKGTKHANRKGALPRFRPLPIALVVASALASWRGQPAFANPQGPQVASGTASISQQGSTLVVKNSPGAIINWQSFSIGAGQTTNFIQQSVSSTVLNRVVGANPTAVAGHLTSNGRVFLINPNGVVFGRGSIVDAAGLVVSTLNLSDADFLAGTLHFVGDTSAGKIDVAGIARSTSGDIYLIAPNVQNEGALSAVNGNVILAAGQSVDILGRGLDNIRFEVQNRSNQAVNLGQLQGDAVGLFAGSIQQSGAVNATAVSIQGGKVVLSAVGDVNLASGSSTRADAAGPGGSVAIASQTGNVTLASGATVSASGQSGGTVAISAPLGSSTVAGTVEATGTQAGPAAGSATGGAIAVLGRTVAIDAGALVDASGDTAGGTVLVGGGVRGANPLVPDAQTTSVAQGATLSADARAQGNGGTLVVFADQSASVAGTLTARGGIDGGNGGYVETSAHQNLTVTQAPNAGVRGPGQVGLWLYDPGNVTIGATDGANNISAATVEAALATADFTVSTGLQGSSGAGDTQSILVSSPITLALTGPAVSRTLTLLAGGGIDVEANITNASANGSLLNLSLQANSASVNANGGAVPATGTGVVTIGSGVAITTGGGSFTATGTQFSSQGTVNTSGTALAPNAGAIAISLPSSFGSIAAGTLIANGTGAGNAGAITLTTSNGEISWDSITSLAQGSGSGGVVTLTSSSDISPTDTSPLQISAGGSLVATAPFGIEITATNNLIPTVTATSSYGDVSITSASPKVTVQGISAGSAVTVTNDVAGGQIRILGPVNADLNNNGTGLSIVLQSDGLFVGPNGSLSANGPTNNFFNNSNVDYVEVFPYTANLSAILTGQSYTAIGANQFPGQLVLAGEFFSQTTSPQILIGSPQTGQIHLESVAGSGGIALPAGTTLSLTAQSITQDAATRLAVDILDVNATSATLTAANTAASSGSNQITLTGTALTDGGSLSVGAAAGQSLLVNADYQNTGLTGYGTLKFNAPATLVETSITGPTSAALNITSTGTLQVGTATNTAPAAVSATGNLGVSVAGDLVVQGGLAQDATATLGSSAGDTTLSAGGAVVLQGGAGQGAFATVDPGNLSITAAALSLSGGGGTNAYAALTASADILLRITGAITLTGGTGGNADAVILSSAGTVSYSAGSCINCTLLTDGNVLTNTTTDAGFFPQPSIIVVPVPPPAPPPPPVQPSPPEQPTLAIDIASLLADENDVIQAVPPADAPEGTIAASVLVLDPRDCGSGP